MLRCMRSTLTLDLLREARRGSLRALVNEALREVLRRLTAPPRRRMRFRTREVDPVAVCSATSTTWPRSSRWANLVQDAHLAARARHRARSHAVLDGR